MSTNNEGDIYEARIYKQYQQLKLVPAGFAPPKPGGHGIDCKLFLNNYNYMTPMNSKEKNRGQGSIVGIELKFNEKADFGQSGVQYGTNWELHGKNDDVSREKRALLKAAGAEQVIRRMWASKIPNIKKGISSTKVSEKGITFLGLLVIPLPSIFYPIYLSSPLRGYTLTERGSRIGYILLRFYQQ